MLGVSLLTGGVVSVIAGLDRTAAVQVMLCRPLVAAPLTGWLLGDAPSGLAIGILLELLWLSRLPVGAAIPLDDTQVAVGATVLALGLGPVLGFTGQGWLLLCLLVAMPLGKVAQWYERLVRNRNRFLLLRADAALAAGNVDAAEASHVRGLLHFAAAGLASYLTIVLPGALLLTGIAPWLKDLCASAAPWVALAFIVVGSAVLIHTLHVSRSLLLFAAAFGAAFLCFWVF